MAPSLVLAFHGDETIAAYFTSIFRLDLYWPASTQNEGIPSLLGVLMIDDLMPKFIEIIDICILHVCHSRRIIIDYSKCLLSIFSLAKYFLFKIVFLTMLDVVALYVYFIILTRYFVSECVITINEQLRYFFSEWYCGISFIQLVVSEEVWAHIVAFQWDSTLPPLVMNMHERRWWIRHFIMVLFGFFCWFGLHILTLFLGDFFYLEFLEHLFLLWSLSAVD